MAELAGVMVGNYFLLECLGREGMVETYRARPTTRGGYDVVLRIFRPAFPDPSNFQEHFATEVEKLWHCHHVHIQPLIEYGAGDDLLYTVTQLTETETNEPIPSLRDRRPDVSEAVELVVRVALAKSPAARFPTVAAFMDALLAAIRGDKQPFVVATPPTRRIPVRARRTPTTWSWVFTLLCVLVMLSGLVGILLLFAASPCHLENLPFLPFQNLGQSGGFHVNPFNGVTPTTLPTQVTSSTPRHTVSMGNAPTSFGRVTPTAELTPLPLAFPTTVPEPTGISTSTPVVCATGTLSIDGSPYLESTLQQMSNNYNALCAGLQIGLRGVGSRAPNPLAT
ncbi:MAG: hypothetical protein NVS3B14_07350 [Ktedonobacteraceae bacterium]